MYKLIQQIEKMGDRGGIISYKGFDNWVKKHHKKFLENTNYKLIHLHRTLFKIDEDMGRGR